jgi:hypothetical protein
MNEQKRYLIFAAVVLFAAVWTVSVNYYRIRYAGDYVSSFFTGVADSVFSFKNKGKFTTVDPEKFLSYENPFALLPDEMYSSGPFLFYKPKKDIKTRDAAVMLIRYSDIYTIPEMESQLKKLNGISNGLIPSGRTILVPDKLPALVEDTRNHKKPEIIFTKGIYLSGRISE